MDHKTYKLNDNSRGAVSILLIIFVVALGYGVYVLFFRNADTQDISISETTTGEVSETTTAPAEENHQRVMSLQPVNGYDARGKATIIADKFGAVEVRLSLALPAEFETTYYEAYLKGTKEVRMGRLSREGGLYEISYTLDGGLAGLDKIVIVVDGNATTVEGKTLPHDVMVGELN